MFVIRIHDPANKNYGVNKIECVVDADIVLRRLGFPSFWSIPAPNEEDLFRTRAHYCGFASWQQFLDVFCHPRARQDLRGHVHIYDVPDGYVQVGRFQCLFELSRAEYVRQITEDELWSGQLTPSPWEQSLASSSSSSD